MPQLLNMASKGFEHPKLVLEFPDKGCPNLKHRWPAKACENNCKETLSWKNETPTLFTELFEKWAGCQIPQLWAKLQSTPPKPNYFWSWQSFSNRVEIVEHQISWTPGHILLDFHWSPRAIAASPLDRKVVGDGPRQQDPEGKHRKHHGKHHETLCVPPAGQASPWLGHNAPLSWNQDGNIGNVSWDAKISLITKKNKYKMTVKSLICIYMCVCH